MAKRKITDRSTAEEIKTAYDQLRSAENEYKTTIDSLSKDAEGYYLDPITRQRLSLADFDKIKASIAAKYDYVDFGVSAAEKAATTNETGMLEINIAPQRFFVEGLGSNSKFYFDPDARKLVAANDAYPGTKPSAEPPKIYIGNPNKKKNTQIPTVDLGALSSQSNDVIRDDRATNSIRKDLQQAGRFVEDRQKFQTRTIGNDIIEDNPNNNAVTNRPTKLPEEFTAFTNSDDTGKSNQSAGSGLNNTNTNSVTVTPDPGREGNGGVTIGTSQATNVNPESAGTPNNENTPVRPNILHNYVNWTYKIGLYMVGMNEYNEMMVDGQVTAQTKQYPIAVSGGYKRKTAGGIDLQGDLYIDNLRFTSVIGNRREGSATNNFDLELTLVEPYGAALVGELTILGDRVNKGMALAEIPYLLEIDFTGYDDNGNAIPSILGDDGKKYIPVRLISMDMKIESAGSRYVFQMVPYSFFAFTQRYAVISKRIKCTGTKVSEYLGDNSNGLIGALNAIEIDNVQKQNQEFPDKYEIKFYSFDKSGTSNQDLENAIVAIPIEGGQATSPFRRPMSNIDPTVQTYGIEANTIIKEAIKNLIYASEYFPKKMTPTTPGENNNPAELLKIIPTIKIQADKYDNQRNEYAKTITYHVFNNLMFGENYQYGGTAEIKDWGYSKIYDYIFTGKNNDIISCDINFNLIYYQKSTTDRKETSVIRNNLVSQYEIVPAKYDTNFIANPSIKVTSIQTGAPGENYRYINATLAAEFADLKMNNSNADMMALDMKIIGDPDWIPQDASVRGGEIKVPSNDKLDQFGSIAVDVAGVYAKLQFKTPRDYNDATGLMEIEQKDSSLVGGVYRVITVENLFESGKYTCTLNMVKIPKQEDNAKPMGTEMGSFTIDEANKATDNPAVTINN